MAAGVETAFLLAFFAGVGAATWAATGGGGATGGGATAGVGAATATTATVSFATDARELRDDRAVVLVAFGAVRFDRLEDPSNAVDHREKRRRDLGIVEHLSVAEATEQRLADVGQLFELAESEEARRPFDRVDAAEDRAEEDAVGRILLESDEVAIELVQVLAALEQELPHQFFVGRHGSPQEGAA